MALIPLSAPCLICLPYDASSCRLRGADIVEFNPLQDATDLTSRVAPKCVKEIAGRMMRSPGG